MGCRPDAPRLSRTLERAVSVSASVHARLHGASPRDRTVHGADRVVHRQSDPGVQRRVHRFVRARRFRNVPARARPVGTHGCGAPCRNCVRGDAVSRRADDAPASADQRLDADRPLGAPPLFRQRLAPMARHLRRRVRHPRTVERLLPVFLRAARRHRYFDRADMAAPAARAAARRSCCRRDRCRYPDCACRVGVLLPSARARIRAAVRRAPRAQRAVARLLSCGLRCLDVGRHPAAWRSGAGTVSRLHRARLRHRRRLHRRTGERDARSRQLVAGGRGVFVDHALRRLALDGTRGGSTCTRSCSTSCPASAACACQRGSPPS